MGDQIRAARIRIGCGEPNSRFDTRREAIVGANQRDRDRRGRRSNLYPTPAVARGSYIDPRVFDRFLCGSTIAGQLRRIEKQGLVREERRIAIELAVLDLLA